MSRRTILAALTVTTTAGATLVATALPAAAAGKVKPGPPKEHAVFLATNATTGNSIGVFSRGRDGRLQAVRHYLTGGLGASLAGAVVDPLASQGALTYDARNRLLYAVNGGSSTLTVFAVDGLKLKRVQVLDTGGALPTSVAVGRDLVYVLDASGDGAITGFKVVGRKLVRLPGSTRSLGLGNIAQPNFLDAPAQVAVAPNGRAVFVTTKKKNTVVSFALNNKGIPSARSVVTPSAAPVPFSMVFDSAGRLLVNEASGSETTYTVNGDATLTTVSHASNNGQVAACWSAVAKGFVYTGNSGSANITAFNENPNGVLSLHDASGIAATTGAGPVDMAVSRDGQFLYQLANGAGAIDEFHVNDDGSLSSLGTVEGVGTVNEGLAAS
jgi:6-phosphogluconolactonase (cycloisomerase 2 family)